MSLYATFNDLHNAAAHISALLSAYVCEEEGFFAGQGIPHAFCGGWQVLAMGGVGNEEIICISTASNRHLRRALCASDGSYYPCSNVPYGSPYSETTPSPLESTVLYSYALDEGQEGDQPRLELHAHPKSGVPMTVIVHPAPGMSESGKSIRIDMLQAGEYGPRHLYKPSNPPYLMNLNGLPFLAPTEYVRAKLKWWSDVDLEHIEFMFLAYASQLDPNRLPVEDMDDFVKYHGGEALYHGWERFKITWGIYLV